MSPLGATTDAAARMCARPGCASSAASVVLPLLTKRRPVDFCLVAASLCRCR